MSAIIIDEGYDAYGVHISTEYHFVDDDVVEKIRSILEEHYSKKIEQLYKE